ncbi:hypothetical protein [Aminipila terrae]|uniref:Uncharacterized protein n=1 Tax=Aminipila terrae TaxID=2697030 RepID=A0A6P1MNL0_9FIRM|nr:hypothetical protein [Aminipila terrae]QHI72595.1 hypothetical protein Ami3637_09455 [Aminipila terrae]
MKNLKYFPFERNRYFYGKLLTVDDFETEQKYVNDKRRMINRFLFGSGVVCGMNVVRVDDTTISVEMGLALDFSGREIVIDTPVIKKLSMVDGFDACMEESENTGYVYLCAEYAENAKEPVHSLTSTNARTTEDVEHNKYAEGCRIFLTSMEPENEGFTTEHFYLDKKTLYWGNGFRIKQIIPRYIKTSGDAEVKIIVENMGQQQPFSFSYELNLSCLQFQGKNQMTVSFDEKNFEKAGRYEFSYPLKAMAVKDAKGSVSVLQDSFKVRIGDKEVKAEAVCRNSCSIMPQNAKKQIMDNYYRTAMDEIVKNTYQQSIYLAKIGVIKAGSAYVIENIETMPFKQYVYNNSLAAAINEIQLGELDRMAESSMDGSTDNTGFSVHKSSLGNVSVATGTVTLDLGIGGSVNQKFFSEEITHGLGLGNVFITLGQAYSVSDDSERVFGSAEVFINEKESPLANVQLAARLNAAKGTFVIGALMKAPTNAKKIRVDWMAARDIKESIHDVSVKKILIKPDMADMEIRETCYFQAVFSNISDKRIKWSVKEQEGGSIDANGMYTAPNVPGVYEIIASSMAYPDIKASTYVVVREVKEMGSKI